MTDHDKRHVEDRDLLRTLLGRLIDEKGEDGTWNEEAIRQTCALIEDYIDMLKAKHYSPSWIIKSVRVGCHAHRVREKANIEEVAGNA